jgi:ribosomal-protein-alanine N-acetyltransferase
LPVQNAPEQIIYGFEQAAWGKGYGPEIVQGLIHFAFEKLNLSELRASASPGNAASIHILRKCGFQRTPSNKGDVIIFRLANPTS